jgi:threonine/homoserine/homoserine lactone efflux protein
MITCRRPLHGYDIRCFFVRRAAVCPRSKEEGFVPDSGLWGWFIVASIVLLLTPGPAVLFIVARSVQQGRAAGLASVLGIHLGTIVHIAAAAIGLSALIVSSALAFAFVKYLGAAYLIWIGVRTFLAGDQNAVAEAVPAEPLRRVFRDGFVVNLFNPKTAIFFLAFLPQFVDPARGAVHWQILALGLTFMGLGIVSDGMFALAAGTAGDFLRRNRRFLRAQRWFAGGSFIGLGVTAAFATRK